jgi:hypothetical protein
MTFCERDLMKHLTMTIRIERGPFHPHIMRFGFWVMMVGARIAGVGHVDVVDGRND